MSGQCIYPLKNTYAGILILLLWAIILIPIIALLHFKESNNDEITYNCFSDLKGKDIGFQTCAANEIDFLAPYPEVKVNFFITPADMILALKSHKIEAFVSEDIVSKVIINKNPDLKCLPDALDTYQNSFALKKNSPLTPKIKPILEKLKKNGTVEKILKIWTGTDDSKKIVPIQDWPGRNGIIKYATDDTSEPVAYLNGEGKTIGIEPHIMLIIAKELDMKLETSNIVYEACIPAVNSGKADIAGGEIPYNESSLETIDLIPICDNGALAIVRNPDYHIKESIGFFQNLKEGFNRNFIVEKRWKSILYGLTRTCLITFSSVFLGLIFALFMSYFRLYGNAFISRITNEYIRIMQGLPDVVFLMILFYVILGESNFSSISVAILGFAIIFSINSTEILTSGIKSIDLGQIEAAIALGYSRLHGIIRIILPQTAIRIFPVMQGEIINLLKNTSIVGYISIIDLTKICDSIRARTLEAFFPLIVCAVIYLIITYLINYLMNKLFVSLTSPTKFILTNRS